jgi:type I site-specific restriction-modification system R (restriction) subunit
LSELAQAKRSTAITTAQSKRRKLLEELIRLAGEMREAAKRGENLGLSSDEIAFYDALSVNESARVLMGDDKLRLIATELVTRVRESVTIDWNLREQARASIRVIIKRICASTAIRGIAIRGSAISAPTSRSTV